MAREENLWFIGHKEFLLKMKSIFERKMEISQRMPHLRFWLFKAR